MCLAARAALAMALCAVAAAPAAGQSIGSLNRTGTGARAAGMANAFVAVSDDGTAASWNPAGLAQLRKPELSIVHGTFVRDFAREGFRSPDGRYTYSSSQSRFTGTVPEFVSLAVPVTLASRPVTFQLDWRRQYQFGGRFEADLLRFPTSGAPADLRLSIDERGEGQIDLWSLAGAVRVGPHTSIGISGSLWRGDWGFSSTLAESPLPATSPATFLGVRENQRLRGANATVGVLFDHGRVRVGAVLKTDFRADFALHNELVSSREPASTSTLPDLRLRLPASIAVGAAFRPGRGVTLALDLTRDPWSRFAIQGAPGGGEVGFFDGLPLAETSARDTVSVNLGVEKLFPREGHVIPLRAGFAFEPQGPRDPVTLDPQDYVFLALGSGYNTNRLKFDFAVQYGWNSHETVAQLATTPRASARAYNAIGRVSSHEWRLKFSAIYRLTDTDKLLGALKKLF